MIVSQSGGTNTIVDSVITSSRAHEEVLDGLTSYGIEWYATEQGDLLVKYWHVGAKGFISPEEVGRFQIGGSLPHEAGALEWVSRHLDDLARLYRGQWIAVAQARVVTSAPTLTDLLERLRTIEIDRPFVTQIPLEPVVWPMAYAG